MNLRYHKSLTPQKWETFPFSRQILMIANELNRAGNWIRKDDSSETKNCYERAIELLWLTVETLKEKRKLRELLRFRGLVARSYLSPPLNVAENEKLSAVLLTLDPKSYNILYKK